MTVTIDEQFSLTFEFPPSAPAHAIFKAIADACEYQGPCTVADIKRIKTGESNHSVKVYLNRVFKGEGDGR